MTDKGAGCLYKPAQYLQQTQRRQYVINTVTVIQRNREWARQGGELYKDKVKVRQDSDTLRRTREVNRTETLHSPEFNNFPGEG